MTFDADQPADRDQIDRILQPAATVPPGWMTSRSIWEFNASGGHVIGSTASPCLCSTEPGASAV